MTGRMNNGRGGREMNGQDMLVQRERGREGERAGDNK